jgi:uncharacterized BrkB/YihY/UPF0761 family membrane protein
VEPADENVVPETETVRSRRARMRDWTAAMQAHGQRAAERAQAERGRHGSVDAVFEMADRDADVGGGIIAGALAYRFFIWLLPLALVVVGGLGIAADAASETPEESAEAVGLGGLVSSSIESAATGSARWYALIVGIPALIYTTRSLLRVLIGAHRLIWADVRAAAPKPTVATALRLLVLLLGFFVVSTLASAVRAWSTGPGLLATLVAVVPYAALWLLVSIRLPHRAASWTDLVAGALLVGVGVELVQLVFAYFIGPYAVAKQGTYGALGAAAALLLGLFLISRLIVGAAIVNATLWERQARRAG